MAKPTKKICFVLTAEFAVRAFLLNHLRALTDIYDVTLVVNTNNPNFLDELGISATVVPLEIAREISLFSDLCSLAKLMQIFYQKKFASVHSVTPKAGLLAMLAAWIVRVPLRVHSFTGQVWVTKTGIKRIILKQFDRLIAMFSTHNIVDSPSQRDFLITEKVISPEMSYVFRNGSISGVDIKRFRPNQEVRAKIRKQLNVTESAVIFLFLGRLTKDKGVLDLAQAFNPPLNKNAHLLFVGPDEQNMTNSIRHLTEAYGYSVHFVGYTSTPEEYMAASDLLCLPSYREGFGSVVVEAGAVGVPAIASKIYGLVDAVVDGETGFLHEPHDITAIRRCMQKLIDDSRLRLKLGKQAQIRAAKEFDSTLITEEWVNFYREILH
jgi:glycosyltransferase involved in cell wall biosynthesis